VRQGRADAPPRGEGGAARVGRGRAGGGRVGAAPRQARRGHKPRRLGQGAMRTAPVGEGGDRGGRERHGRAEAAPWPAAPSRTRPRTGMGWAAPRMARGGEREPRRGGAGMPGPGVDRAPPRGAGGEAAPGGDARAAPDRGTMATRA
jgi:hypothetical protein